MFRYIDLFCGIGGFHKGIDRVAKKRNLKTKCVFAADNDENAAAVYKLNYKIDALNDLKSEETHNRINEAIGNEELTCIFAGFPCQPFSKAGNQEGFRNEIKGTLFFEIMKIVENQKPPYILLENVRNLRNHDNGNTWNVIKNALKEEGYIVDDIIISPNEIYNIPALRERIFIMAYNRNKLGINSKEQIEIDKSSTRKQTSIYTWGDFNKGLKKKYFEINSMEDIEKERKKTINMWNELYHMLKKNNGYIISPLWPKFFKKDVENFEQMPQWKQAIIRKNQRFYKDNKKIYDEWYKKNKNHFDKLSESDKKFEWNAGDSINDIWEGIIQFRPSGVRVKKPDFIPTLVAINQTPILGIEKRYLKPSEIAKLYGFGKINFGEEPLSEQYKQLGNTVSVDVVEHLIEHMLRVTEYGG